MNCYFGATSVEKSVLLGFNVRKHDLSCYTYTECWQPTRATGLGLEWSLSIYNLKFERKDSEPFPKLVTSRSWVGTKDARSRV